MSELWPFLVQNVALSGTFLLLLMFLLLVEFRLGQQKKHTVTAEAAIELVNKKKGLFVDARSAEAFEQGHIGGAMHLPALDAKAVRRLEKYKQRPLIVVCDTAATQSRALQAALQSSGFETAMLLSGGMRQWRAQGLPVVS